MARLLLLVLLLAPATAQAGAWTKGFGEYYSKVGADFYKGIQYVDPSTGEPGDADFFGQSYSLYGEFGVLPVWPLQVSVLAPLSIGILEFHDDVFDEDDTARATTVRFGDLRLSIQTAILREGFQLGIGAEVKVPLYSNDEVGAEFGVWKEAFPLPGDGQIDVTPLLVFGGAFPNTPVFLQGGLGYRFRTEEFVGWETDLEFVDSLVWNANLGVTFGPVLAMLLVDGNKNFVADVVSREALSIGVGTFITLTKGLAFEARFAGDVWAANTTQGISFGAGLSWRMPYPGYVAKQDRAPEGG